MFARSISFRIGAAPDIQAVFSASSYHEFIRRLVFAWQTIFLAGSSPESLELFVLYPGCEDVWFPVGHAGSRPVRVCVTNPFLRQNNHVELWGKSMCAVIKAAALANQGPSD